MSKLYVGNLSFNTTEQELSAAMAAYEPVSVNIIKDRDTGRSKGFGFVTCSSDERAEEAQQASIELDGRVLKIDAARPPASGGGFGGGSSAGRRPQRDSSRSSGGYAGRYNGR